MSRASVVLRALGPEPISTSDLYDRVGYPALTRVGLIPYAAFRETLVALVAAGQARQRTEPDGTTVWWRASGAGTAAVSGSGQDPEI